MPATEIKPYTTVGERHTETFRCYYERIPDAKSMLADLDEHRYS